jgi:hypothetical protein
MQTRGELSILLRLLRVPQALCLVRT